MSVILLIIGLILFVGLVVVHEYGHFIAARRNGVEVEEFGIGFPPRAKLLTKKNGTEYTLNWLPLGGFVKLKGEHDADTQKGTFGAASLKTKVKIMLAGVGMNLLAAFIIFTLSALVGLPKLIENQFTVASDTRVTNQKLLVGFVEPDSPASKAGLAVRDELVAIKADSQSYAVNSAEKLPEVTKKLAGQAVELQVNRGGDLVALATTLRSEQEVSVSKHSNTPKGYLGISPTEYALQRSTWSAPIVSLGLIKQFTELTLKGLGTAITGLAQGNGKQASEQVSGPVGIFVIFKEGSSLGYEFILLLIGLISLTLAIMNVLPIPALDGGRLFVTLLFRAIRKPLREGTEDLIHGSGFALLMVLFVLITIVDIRRFF